MTHHPSETLLNSKQNRPEFEFSLGLKNVAKRIQMLECLEVTYFEPSGTTWKFDFLLKMHEKCAQIIKINKN